MPTTKKYKGGQVIGHGGFGCIFHPNLECKNVKTGKIVRPSSKRITKLMKSTRYFNEESSDVKRVNKVLPKIPNYKKYFIYETIKCKPLKITQHDLVNFSSECKKFKDYTPEQLLKLKSLLYTYGGENLKDYIDRVATDAYKMAIVHTYLCDVFLNAIIPLNALGVYHSDIKLDNMLFNKSQIRIIDWGFVSFFKPSSSTIPIKFKQFPVHFNMPITILLFNSQVTNMIYMRYGTDQFNACKTAVLTATKDSGHFKDLENLYDNVKPASITFAFVDYVVMSLCFVVNSYTQNGVFKQFEFFTNVYVHNVDTHGFLVAYYFFAKKIILTENLGVLNAFMFTYLFNSLTTRLNPIDMMTAIINMKYFHI